MNLIENITFNGMSFSFWKGIDISVVESHSKYGSDGFMVILIDSVITERRNLKIKDILSEKSNDSNLDKLFKDLDNSYILMYSTSGVEDQIIVNIIKDKIFKAKFNHPFEISTIDK